MIEKKEFENTQVVLFLENNVESIYYKIANKIYDVIPELGQPNILNFPQDMPIDARQNVPCVIFNSNQKLTLNITYKAINILINKLYDNDTKNIKTIINNIFEILNSNNINVKNIGIVKNIEYADFDIEKLKKVYLNDKSALDSDLFNLSWYKSLENLNEWRHIQVKKIFNNKGNEEKYLGYVIDINNLPNTNIMSINDIEKFMQKFYECVDSYEEEFIKKLEE